MTATFAQRMKALPDVDLIRISSSEENDGYEVEAIRAAINELAHRNVSSDIIAETLEMGDEDRFNEVGKSEAELTLVEKSIFTIFGPFLFLTVGAALILRFRGYTTKSNEGFICIGGSFLLYGLIAAIIGFFSS